MRLQHSQRSKNIEWRNTTFFFQVRGRHKGCKPKNLYRKHKYPQVDCDDNLQRRNEITNGIKMYIFLKVSCCEMCGCARARGKRKLNSNRRGRGLGMLKKSEDPKALCGCPYEIDDERLLRSFVVFFNHFSFLILFSNTFPCERYWGVFFYWVI